LERKPIEPSSSALASCRQSALYIERTAIDSFHSLDEHPEVIFFGAASAVASVPVPFLWKPRKKETE
jgi:hypothetical protein